MKFLSGEEFLPGWEPLFWNLNRYNELKLLHKDVKFVYMGSFSLFSSTFTKLI